MSTAQSRSWRPQRGSRRRGERKRKLFGAITVLTLIAAFLAYLFWPNPVPATHFAVLVDVADPVESDGLPVMGHPAVARNATQLTTLFEVLHADYPQLVAAPVTVPDPVTLGGALKAASEQRLILYAAVQATTSPIASSSDVTVVLGKPRADGKVATLAGLLDALQQLRCRSALLLLEVAGPEAGIGNGVIADHLMGEIRKQVEAAGVEALTVICASGAGQRSWEYLRPSTDSGNAPETDLSAGGYESLSGRIDGTAFGHFLAEALYAGKGETPEDLLAGINAGLTDWVTGYHGVEQEAVLIAAGPKYGQRPLLDRVGTVSRPSAASQTDGGDEGDSAGDAAEADGSTDDAGKNTTEKSSAERLMSLVAQRDILAQQNIATAVSPVLWMTLQARLLNAERALMTGEESSFNQLYDAARKDILSLQNIRSGETPADESPVGHWLCLWEPDSAAELEPQFRKLMTDLMAAGDLPVVLPSEQRERPFIRGFTRWVVNYLRTQVPRLETVDSVEAGQRAAAWRLAFRRLRTAGWNPEDLPHQLMTLVELSAAAADEDALVVSAPEIMRLLDLREQAMRMAVGQLDDGAHVRLPTWERNADPLENALRRLVAAESWLRVGRAGLVPAREEIQAAAEILDRVTRDVADSERLQAVADAQRYVLPRVIELMAAVQEDVPVSAKELQEAREIAEAILAQRSAGNKLPESLLSAPGFQKQEIDAMFALTRSFADQPIDQDDDQHYRRLWSYVKRRALEQPKGWTRYRLLQVPPADEFPERARVLASLGAPVRSQETLRPGLTRTGLWMSFWSIRLLDALGLEQNKVDALWQKWADLTTALSPTAADSADASTNDSPRAGVTEQVALAAALRDAWRETVTVGSDGTAGRDVFAGISNGRTLLLQEIRQRRKITSSADLTNAWTALNEAGGGAPLPATPSLSVNQSAIELNADGAAALPLSLSGEAQVYLFAPDFRFTGSEIERRGDWISPRQIAPGEEAAVPLTSGQLLEEPVEIPVVAVDRDGIVTARSDVMIHPNSETDWLVEFVVPAGDRLMIARRSRAREGLDQYFVDLPGSTRAMVEGKLVDTPVPMTVNLLRQNDRSSVSSVSVEMFRLTGGARENVWPAPVVLELDPETGVAQIPLGPPPAAEGEAATAAVSLDLSEGFGFVITPQNVVTQTTRTIEFQPRFLPPAQYVNKPRPQWDRLRNTLTVEVERAAAVPRPRPARVPVELHLTPELQGLLQSGSATSAPDLKPGSRTAFEFQFDGAIQQILRSRGQFIGDSIGQSTAGGLEFSMSVAGTPHVWRWEIRSDGVESLDERAEPCVRAVLNLTNEKDAMPVALVPELKLGTTWPAARMEAIGFVYGGQIQEEGNLELSLSVQERRSRVPTNVLPPTILRRRLAESVSAARGEDATWQISTHTAPWKSNAFRLADLGLGDGHYDLKAVLRHTDPAENFSAQAVVSFVADATPPEFRQRATFDREPTPFNMPLQGTLQVNDPESGVVSARVGLQADPATMIELNVPGSGGAVPFSIPPSEFPKIAEEEFDQRDRVQVHVLLTNGVGITSSRTYDTAIFRPGKAADVVMEEKPGSLTVEIATASSYLVKISGPKSGQMTGTGAITFPDLPPGTYQVSWHVENRPSYNKGGKTVKIRSGQAVTISTKG